MDNTVIYYLASILDPRIKSQYLKTNFPNGDRIVNKIRDYIQEVYGKPAPPISQTYVEQDSEELSFHHRMLLVCYHPLFLFRSC